MARRHLGGVSASWRGPRSPSATVWSVFAFLSSRFSLMRLAGGLLGRRLSSGTCHPWCAPSSGTRTAPYGGRYAHGRTRRWPRPRWHHVRPSIGEGQHRHVRPDQRAAAVVGGRARRRALRRRPVRADQRPARRLRRVAGDDRAGRGLAARALAAHLPARPGRRLRRRRAAGSAGRGARLRAAVGGAAADRAGPGAAAGRRGAGLRLALGGRVHVGARDVRLRGGVPGQRGGDGDVLHRGRGDHPRRCTRSPAALL